MPKATGDCPAVNLLNDLPSGEEMANDSPKGKGAGVRLNANPF
jgi:hypothetical protein